MADPIRVLIVDDHAVVRSGIRLLLAQEADLEPVGEAGTGREAVFQARDLKPDVILMDVVMPDQTGLDVLPQLLHELRAELRGTASAFDPVDVYRARYAETAGAPELARLQDVDFGIYLVDDLLVKTDRASMRTAETHRAHIMQKLRLQSRAELVRYAIAQGFLEQ